MEKTLSDLEGLRISMDIESRGFNFYKQARDKAPNEQAKALFQALMEEEQEHLETFTEFFRKIEATKEAHAAEYLFDAEISQYVTVLAESHVFPKEADAALKIDELASVKNIIKLALNAEKDSILLYDELAKASKFEQAKAVFLKLKKEEQGHVVRISNKLKEIAG